MEILCLYILGGIVVEMVHRDMDLAVPVGFLLVVRVMLWPIISILVLIDLFLSLEFNDKWDGIL